MTDVSLMSDIGHRRPVWEALSSLFLDTDTSIARPWRARVLAASPYSLAELDDILMDEVYPVCRWNLLDVPVSTLLGSRRASWRMAARHFDTCDISTSSDPKCEIPASGRQRRRRLLSTTNSRRRYRW